MAPSAAALLLLLPLLAVAQGSAAAPVYVIHLLADDLGYHDVAFRNGQSSTPNIDGLVRDGIEIPEFYVYKMCAPSRGSIMSGRYPMHIGMYNNNGLQQGVSLDFDLLPAVLKQAGWASHALGKWHVGWWSKAYLPTSRGFDTFLGSSGNTKDYWNHTIGGPQYSCGGVKEWKDFINCTGACGPGDVAGDEAFGVYDPRVLTKRATDIIDAHDTSRSLYMYFAFHNVHNPSEAPCETVAHFGLIRDDIRKVTDASLLELDWGAGNVSAHLGERGMLDRTVWIFHTDNGGPTSHACNYPLRGGKFTFWEGGVRGVAAVSSRMLPDGVRGTQFQGLAHMTDWYATIIEGLAGLTMPASTGPVPPDGVNLWPALIGGTASPRTEVLHLPLPNSYVNTTLDSNNKSCTPADGGSGGCSPSMRVGDHKIIFGWPGEDGVCHLPPPLKDPIPYGQSKGNVAGDHCSGGRWDSGMTRQNATCVPFCFFDVKNDPSESNDLSASTDAVVLAALSKVRARLEEVSQTGVPIPVEYTKAEVKKVYKPLRCAQAQKTGFWLPTDWAPTAPTLPPGPAPPAPPAPPSACVDAMRQQCPSAQYTNYSACRQCCSHHKPALSPPCHPKDFNVYCNKTGA